jgi:hypothetical protein
MTARRLAVAGGLALAGGTLAWFARPRPALELRVTLGGVATTVDRFGRQAPLADTLRLGGGGRRRVRIVNADTVPHRLGLFAARAGESVEYTLPRPGSYSGTCTAHGAASELTVVVR